MLKATKFEIDPGAFDKLSLGAKYDELGKLMKAESLWRALGPIVPSVPLGGLSAQAPVHQLRHPHVRSQDIGRLCCSNG